MPAELVIRHGVSPTPPDYGRNRHRLFVDPDNRVPTSGPLDEIALRDRVGTVVRRLPGFDLLSPDRFPVTDLVLAFGDPAFEQFPVSTLRRWEFLDLLGVAQDKQRPFMSVAFALVRPLIGVQLVDAVLHRHRAVASLCSRSC